MTFRLFGVSVEIQFGFWITTVLLGMRGGGGDPREVLIWVAVVLFSILIHEYGHAFAIMRHRVEPSISLHWMGGTTRYREVLPLGRRDQAIISLAGPFAGLAFAGLVYGALRLVPSAYGSLPPLGREAIDQILWVNVGWGLINLIPVLPWDGGHVLEAALGPKRGRLTASISLAVAAAGALYGLSRGEVWIAFLFGLGAFRSLERLRGEGPAPVMPSAPRARPPEAPSLSGALLAHVRRARRALAEERLDEALALAEDVLAGRADPDEPGPPPAPAAFEALEIIAWSRLLGGSVDLADQALRSAARIRTPDAALAAAVRLARGDRKEARRLLEEARKSGDHRKEVVGPLIQVLLDDREVARAAAVAFDIVDSLSDDDARKMAGLAFDAAAYDWSARLYEAVFGRDGAANDAYDAARAHAKDGQTERAMTLLRRAVDAGFTDRARAWSDAALEALRGPRGLDTLLPRP